jgi:hypothetical protein
MAVKKPLALYSGSIQELTAGDTLTGAVANGGSTAVITTSATAPASPATGDLWIDTSANRPLAFTPSAGGSGFSFKYGFSTLLTNSPATGTLRLNNATPSSATQMFIYDVDAGGVNIDVVTNLINPTDFVQLSNSDRSKHHTFTVIQPPIESGHIDTITLRWLCGSATNFTDGEQVFLTIQHADFDDIQGLAIQMVRCNFIP